MIKVNFYNVNDQHLLEMFSAQVPDKGSSIRLPVWGDMNDYRVAWIEWEVEQTIESHILCANVFLLEK